MGRPGPAPTGPSEAAATTAAAAIPTSAREFVVVDRRRRRRHDRRRHGHGQCHGRLSRRAVGDAVSRCRNRVEASRVDVNQPVVDPVARCPRAGGRPVVRCPGGATESADPERRHVPPSAARSAALLHEPFHLDHDAGDFPGGHEPPIVTGGHGELQPPSLNTIQLRLGGDGGADRTG